MIKAGLQARLGQHMTLTPQLRMAIRLLQMSAVELEAEVNQALESNPLLDREDEASADATPRDAAEAVNGAAQTNSTPPGDQDGHERPSAGGDDDLGRGPDAYAEEWGRASDGVGPARDGSELAAATPALEDLHDHLFWQLHLTPMSPRDQRIGVSLIEAINDEGYLEGSLDDIRACIGPEAGTPPDDDEILAVLHRIQRFDPLGVGARDLSECLCVQLSAMAADVPALALARTIACGHLEELARQGPERLAASLGHPPETMAEAVALLRSLDPRPGSSMGGGEPDYIVPDCVPWREGGVWQVALAPGSQPRLAVNQHYQGLIGKASRSDASYLKGQLQEARWLIRSLQTRAETLRKVADCIVRQQSGFLDHGPQAMRPLTLREVAEEVGLHESTVSRATARKYLHTPRGTFEFRHFFASGVATGDGGAASSTAIQAMIRKLVEAEDPRKPLSDARIASQLKADGIPVARRTVAKYREAMNIPASNERQRLG